MPWVDLSDNDPGAVDQFVRAAIHKCWHALPPDRQDLDTVEALIRRLVDRALRDFREDATRFEPADPDDPSEDFAIDPF